MKDHYVSYEQAKRLHELGFNGVDKYYVTESFCYGGNPDDYFSEGQLVDEYIVYFVNDNNEDDYRGIPAPRLDQAAAWMRDVKGVHIAVDPYCKENNSNTNICNAEDCFWAMELSSVPFGYWLNVSKGEFDTYELALLAGISKALELLGKEVKE